MVNGKRKQKTKYMVANCEGSQSPPNAVELRKKKKKSFYATTKITELQF
jgi:hypothetical protein